MKVSRLIASVCVVLGLVVSNAVASAPPVRAVYIEVEGELASRPGPLDWLFGAEAPMTTHNLITGIDGISDGDTDVIVVRLRDAVLTRDQIDDLGAALGRASERGVRSLVFNETFETPALMLGAHADWVVMQSGGMVSMPGLYTEEMYLGDTLRWVGVDFSVVQIGDYKGAMETLERGAPSEFWNQNIEALIDDMYAQMRTTIGEGRGLSADELDAAFAGAWWADAQRAEGLKLIDASVDLPDLADWIALRFNTDETQWRDLEIAGAGGGVDMSSPLAMFTMLSREPPRRTSRPTIAVVHIDGPIVDGESSVDLLTGSQSVGSRTIRRILDDLADDANVRGVVLRIESPGGSAIASEIIWQGAKRYASETERPVWTSVGSMAASGGYYIAVAGDRIYASPSSIVGSIGVVGGKPAMGGLFEKLRINAVQRTRGPQADLLSMTSPWDETQRALIADRMRETYDLFINRVREGRSGIDTDRVAAGRLFVGSRAKDLNMVDELGCLDTSIAAMARSLNLREGGYDVMHYPGSMSIQELLEESLGGFGLASVAGKNLGQSGLGPIAASVRDTAGALGLTGVLDQLSALAQLRNEPVLLTSPRAIIIR